MGSQGLMVLGGIGAPISPARARALRRVREQIVNLRRVSMRGGTEPLTSTVRWSAGQCPVPAVFPNG